MKKISKAQEPIELASYRRHNPDRTWQNLRDDEQQTYEIIRRQCLSDQGQLCAFCESRLPDTPIAQRVEHFHPKSNKRSGHNWALDWANMLAVCVGGTNSALQDHNGQYLEPMAANISCDAHKDHLIQKKKLPKTREGSFLNPMQIPTFPILFDLDKQTGEFCSNSVLCTQVTIPSNDFNSTSELIEKTIVVFNLNCDRLTQQRRQVLFSIEREKKKARQKGENPSEALSKLAERYFREKWPAFFTTRRILLGQYAENYLHRINYNG
jgi:uncharacterized protein (TIGR02646 family)